MRFFRFCPSSQQLLGLNKLKLPHRFGSELVAVLAKVALLQASFAAVIPTSLHHPIAAAVRTPSVFSSHNSSSFWYMPQNIIGIYHFVK
jgi:hypothetical protein